FELTGDMRHGPDLIVPIGDRRKRRRILTLKTLGKTILVIAIFFLGVTIQSDLRHGPADEYGRLFRKQVSGQVTVAPKNYPMVREAPIEDQQPRIRFSFLQRRVDNICWRRRKSFHAAT